MLAIVPLVCFAFFTVIYAVNSSEPGVLTRWRISFLAAAVTWGLALTAMTEVLSLFGLITFEWLLSLWLGVTLLSAVISVAVSTREKLKALLQFPSIPRFELWCLAGVAIIAFVVGLVAFVAPPNNADSMFYHMARVLHWIQNQTVAHYPTNILHQLFLPPWAEFAIMHLQVLSGGDQWANLVQWFSMVGSIIGASLIARQLGADIHGQVLTAVVVATIPMGILQASSTKNDYVTAFWLVSLMYYVLRFKMQPGWTHALGVGASLALAMLTKPTAYFFAAPLLAWFTVVALRSWGWKGRKVWQALLLIGAIVLSVNLGHYARNFDLWGHPLGIDQEDPHPNKVWGVPVIVSNVLRNISVHIGTRYLHLNEKIRATIEFFHSLFGMDVNDPRTTFSGDFSQSWFSHQEDRAGNPLHLMLIMVSLALLFASHERQRAQDLMAYAVVLIAAFLLFCLFLKWSVRHSRPHLPLFVLWAPFISSVLLRRKNYITFFLIAVILMLGSIFYTSRYAIVLVILFLILCACFKWQIWTKANYFITLLIPVFLISASTLYVFRNQNRPLVRVGDEMAILNTNRIDQMFMYHPYHDLRDIYYKVAHFIKIQNCSEVGLITSSYGLEYPLWIILQEIKRTRTYIEHVNVTNISAIKFTLDPFASFMPCAIVVLHSDDYSAPNPEGSGYTEAISAGPVSVFTRRQEH
jgi:hypothetical protein